MMDTYGWGVENGDNLKKVSQEDLIEKIGVSLFKAVEVNIFFETGGLATHLSEASLTMVSVGEIRRNAGGCV